MSPTGIPNTYILSSTKQLGIWGTPTNTPIPLVLIFYHETTRRLGNSHQHTDTSRVTFLSRNYTAFGELLPTHRYLSCYFSITRLHGVWGTPTNTPIPLVLMFYHETTRRLGNSYQHTDTSRVTFLSRDYTEFGELPPTHRYRSC